MKIVLGVLTAAALMAATPAWAQSPSSQSSAPDQGKQNAPGTGGTSKPGVAGLPGSKSGPAMTKSGDAAPSSQNEMTKHRDESKVPGLPGSKSGPAVTSPNKTPSVTAPEKDTHS
jgi:hypothetical protein